MADMGSRKLKFGPNIANKLATNVTESFWAFFYIFEIMAILVKKGWQKWPKITKKW